MTIYVTEGGGVYKTGRKRKRPGFSPGPFKFQLTKNELLQVLVNDFCHFKHVNSSFAEKAA